MAISSTRSSSVAASPNIFSPQPIIGSWVRVAIHQHHQTQLIHPACVKPYLKTNKNDFNDVEAICEAVSHPTLRYVSPRPLHSRMFIGLACKKLTEMHNSLSYVRKGSVRVDENVNKGYIHYVCTESIRTKRFGE